jgi:hypothetical protein
MNVKYRRLHKRDHYALTDFTQALQREQSYRQVAQFQKGIDRPSAEKYSIWREGKQGAPITRSVNSLMRANPSAKVEAILQRWHLK